MTVLMTTHYMDEAGAYCDRVSLMHRARSAPPAVPPTCAPNSATA
jgi:ABC-type nitrate/sulfonate/bicarbonate transport system ATPase subunit